VKKEQESIDVMAQKMMRGKVEPFALLIMVWVVPITIHATKKNYRSTIDDISTRIHKKDN
jgi:nicotinamide riboside transporter PnuC